MHAGLECSEKLQITTLGYAAIPPLMLPDPSILTHLHITSRALQLDSKVSVFPTPERVIVHDKDSRKATPVCMKFTLSESSTAIWSYKLPPSLKIFNSPLVVQVATSALGMMSNNSVLPAQLFSFLQVRIEDTSFLQRLENLKELQLDYVSVIYTASSFVGFQTLANLRFRCESSITELIDCITCLRSLKELTTWCDLQAYEKGDIENLFRNIPTLVSLRVEIFWEKAWGLPASEKAASHTSSAYISAEGQRVSQHSSVGVTVAYHCLLPEYEYDQYEFDDFDGYVFDVQDGYNIYVGNFGLRVWDSD